VSVEMNHTVVSGLGHELLLQRLIAVLTSNTTGYVHATTTRQVHRTTTTYTVYTIKVNTSIGAAKKQSPAVFC